MKKIISISIIIILTVTLSSCSKQSNTPEPKPDEALLPVKIIEEIEAELVKIMKQVDLVPYYQKQITEKKKKEKEKMQAKSGGKNEEFQPAPVTSKDVLLMNILKQERPGGPEEVKKIPDDISLIWHEINEGITNLHQKWSDIKPELKKSKVSTEIINNFDDTLNSLTISSTENNHLETLTGANLLTAYMPEIIKGGDILTTIYSIKYHTRQIVLNIANNNYQNASKNIKAIKGGEKTLTTMLEKEKFKGLVDKLTVSVSDLEEALPQKDINLVKIKASILMKNIYSIQEKLVDISK